MDHLGEADVVETGGGSMEWEAAVQVNLMQWRAA